MSFDPTSSDAQITFPVKKIGSVQNSRFHNKNGIGMHLLFGFLRVNIIDSISDKIYLGELFVFNIDY